MQYIILTLDKTTNPSAIIAGTVSAVFIIGLVACIVVVIIVRKKKCYGDKKSSRYVYRFNIIIILHDINMIAKYIHNNVNVIGYHIVYNYASVATCVYMHTTNVHIQVC